MGQWIVQYPTWNDDGVLISDAIQRETVFPTREIAEWYFELSCSRIHPPGGVWRLLYRSTETVRARGGTLMLIGTEADEVPPATYATHCEDTP